MIAGWLMVMGVVVGGVWGAGKLWPATMTFVMKERNDGKILVDKVRGSVEKLQGSYGFWVENLTDGVSYGWNEEMQVEAASMIKVPIMLAVEKKIQTGEITLTDKYILAERDRRTGSGPMEYYAAGTEVTIDKVMEEMGKKSDNTGAAAMTRKVGDQAILDVISELKMEDTDWEEKMTTARDMGLMWKEVYRGEILKDGKERFWNYLEESIYEDRITLGLPEEGIRLVHKVGTGDGVWEDGGFVISLDSSGSADPFVLVVVNKDVDMEQAKTAVAEISRLVWEFQKGLKK